MKECWKSGFGLSYDWSESFLNEILTLLVNEVCLNWDDKHERNVSDVNE